MITHARLLEVVHYEPKSGKFTWRIANSVRVKVGAEAGASPNGVGRYKRIQIDKVRYFAHVLAWFYMTGIWRPDEIDHRDRDGSNNRWKNLRLATRKQNNENKRQYRRKTPGVRGVYPSGKKWYANIRHNGEEIYLGTFKTLSAAKNARRAAERETFTHSESCA